MSRIPFLLLLILFALPVKAQWTVSTPVPGPVGIEDGLVMGSDGSLFVSTYDGSTVKRIATDGEVSVYAGGFSSPNGLALSGDGTLYVTNAGSNRISRVLPDGTVEHQWVTGMQNPAGLAIDPTSTWLYVAQYQASRITRIRLDDVSVREVIASGFPLNGPVGMDFDGDGNLLVGNFNSGTVVRVTGTNSMETVASIPSFMGFLTVVGSDIYATSYSTNRVYHINPSGATTAIAGAQAAGTDDGPGEQARFNGPNGIVATASGDTLYVSDYGSESLRMLVRDASTTSTFPLPDQKPVQIDVWPNPFHSQATFTIRGHQPSPDAHLDIVDMLGRRVHSLPIAGDEVRWNGVSSDGRTLGSGIYFVRFVDGATHKMAPIAMIR